MHQYVDVVQNLSTEETLYESNFLNQVSFSSRMTSTGTSPITLNFSRARHRREVYPIKTSARTIGRVTSARAIA